MSKPAISRLPSALYGRRIGRAKPCPALKVACSGGIQQARLPIELMEKELARESHGLM